jgi:hypothetical protein
MLNATRGVIATQNFSATSSLLESFRASSPKRIYLHGKIFQLLNIFTQPTKKQLNLGKFPAYNGLVKDQNPYRAMKHFTFSLSAVALATLLTACGGSDAQMDAPLQTAAVMQSDASVAQGGAQPNQATQPQPDCAQEGCNNLRIINGNAEAYRLEALERAQREAGQAGA